ncbi:MAG: T9SS type A sorting domain-containing protein [Chitinophagaceae bacterium]|nr:T9SS type A sorting domain-containing protein [Chitinophagaceae bacterium]
MIPDASLFKKLAGYTAAAAGFLYCNNGQAQIIYTDVLPDDTLSEQGLYGEFAGLDLDNDGTFDFWVGHAKHIFNYWYGEVVLNPVDTSVNSVMGSHEPKTISTTSGTFTYTSAQIKKFPFQLAFDDIIGPGSNWVKPHSFDNNNLSPYEQAWFNEEESYNGEYGLWTNGQTAFAGVRLNNNGVYYYGWIRLEVDAAANFVIIKDFAVNIIPEEPIMAGKGVVTDIPEISDEEMLRIIPNPVGDLATITFSLATPSIIQLELMDLQGRKIKSIATTDNTYTTGIHSMNINVEDLPAGSYLLFLHTNHKAHAIKMMKQ